MTLLLAALLLGAKPLPPASSRCTSDALRVELVFGDLVADVAGLRLQDPPLPDVSAAVPYEGAPRADEATFIGPPSPPLFVHVGSAGEAGAYELRLGHEWWLVSREHWVKLDRPRSLSARDVPRVLGNAEGVAWLWSAGSLARVDVTAGVMKSGSVTRDTRPWHLLRADSELWFIVGDRLVTCDAAARCRDLVRLPVSVAQVVHGTSAWLVGGPSGSGAKIYRVSRDAPSRPELVLAAPVANVCHVEEGVGWIYSAESTGAWSLARATTESTTLAPLSRRDAVLSALMTPASPQLLDALLATAMRERWQELELIGLMLASDSRPGVRAAATRALTILPSTRSFATLWLLGRDPDADVRLSALQATAAWCSKQRAVPCASALKQYIEDGASEVSWQARDLLLAHDPWTALRGAPPAYKVDAVSSLALLVQRSSNDELHEALRSLAVDPDPVVRGAATAAMAGMGL